MTLPLSSGGTDLDNIARSIGLAIPLNAPTIVDKYICQDFQVKLLTKELLKDDNNDSTAAASSGNPKTFVALNLFSST